MNDQDRRNNDFKIRPSSQSRNPAPFVMDWRKGNNKINIDVEEELKTAIKDLGILETLLEPYEKFCVVLSKSSNAARAVGIHLERARQDKSISSKSIKTYNEILERYNMCLNYLSQLENNARTDKCPRLDFIHDDDKETKNTSEWASKSPRRHDSEEQSKFIERMGVSRNDSDSSLEVSDGSTIEDRSKPLGRRYSRETANKIKLAKEGLSASANKKHTTSTPVAKLTTQTTSVPRASLPSTGVQPFVPSSDGKIAIKVAIPIIVANQTMTFQHDYTIKQVKNELMKKVKRAGIKNSNPASYYIRAHGLRILDENIHLNVLYPNNKEMGQMELIRPFEYEINVPDSPANCAVIITESMPVSEAALRLSRTAFYNTEYKKYNFYLLGARYKEPEKLDPSATFISYGFREHDKLYIIGEPKESNDKELKEILVIQYSPFEVIDTQKNMVKRKGWLKKQGGSKGGNKAWQNRFFDLDDNIIAYYVDEGGKQLKGVVNMAKFLQVIQEPPEVKTVKGDDHYYFAIEESNRRIILRTKSKEDMEGWIESLRKYSDLIRMELSYNIKIYTPEDIPGMESKVMKKESRNLFRKKDFQPAVPVQSISSPFGAAKLFSVNADWQWSSADNPLEVFEFIEELGVGACGAVYKAEHKKLTNFVLAVKIVKAGNKQLQEDLEKEMEILKKARSENIVGYYGTILREHDTWILMDYCGVGAVKDVIRVTMETLNEIQCQYVVHHTLKGLHYMHSMKILHLDIKAANILLTETGVVKLADFGVSQVLKTNEMTKEQDDYVGSPLFMAPEIIRKEGYNHKADIWSLGITIIEMVQGRPPNGDINSIEKLPLLASRDPPKFSNPRQWSPSFNKFLATCLVKYPTDRPAAIDLLMDPFMSPMVVSGKECLAELIYECLDLQAAKRKKITSISQVVHFG